LEKTTGAVTHVMVEEELIASAVMAEEKPHVAVAMVMAISITVITATDAIHAMVGDLRLAAVATATVK
jgi:hypothetical protein